MDLIWNEPPNKKTNQQYICARRGGGERVL